MKWGRKQQQQEEEQQQKQEQKQRSSSTASSLFSWVSKLKQMASKSSKPKTPTKPEPALTRSPPAPSRSTVDAPGRLSVGEDDTLLARARTSHARSFHRSTRHNSVGDLDWRPLSSTSRPDFELPRSLLHCPPRPDPPTTTTSDTDPSETGPSFRRRCRRQRRRSKAVDGTPAATPLKPIETGGQRRSLTGRARSKPKRKVRVCSPRPSAVTRAEVCKLRAAARRRALALAAEAEDGGLEGMAVVKCSCDPQRDFRESMVEMIWERGMEGRPEELERLLACYLELNADEHHDLIVKVFRQVWFDLLEPGRLD